MANNIDPVEFIEKYFGIELMEYQKIMLRAIDKNDEFIRGHRLSNQEGLRLCGESRVDLDILNTILEPFRAEVQNIFGIEDSEDVVQK